MGIIPHDHEAFPSAPTVKVSRTMRHAAFARSEALPIHETTWPRLCVLIDWEAGHVHVER